MNFLNIKKWFNKNSAIKLGALLMATSMLTACSDGDSTTESADAEKHINYLYNFSTNSLDPHTDSSYVPLRAGVAETLVKLDEEKLEVVPWLAESWSGDDGIHWTINLRQDVTFQNGKQMDAEAVKASLERSISENIAIENALKIDTIEADGYTLNITTKEMFPEFITELVNPNVSIIDVTEEDIVNHPVGTGPFEVESFTPGSKVELDSYDEYWDGASPLDSVTFSFNEDSNARTLALQSGEADIVYRPEVETVEELKAQEGIKVDDVETFRVHQMTMNLERPAMQDVNVRRAIDALIDRQSIVDTIELGYATPAYGPFAPSLPFAPTYDETATGSDLAVQYLEEAGYTLQDGKMQKDGEQLSLTLLTYSARADLPLIAQVFQSDAKQIGIDVEIRQIDTPEEYMTANDDWDLATYSNLTAPRGDGGYYLNATYYPTGALNFSHTNEPELTAILDELNKTVDTQQRAALSEQAADYVQENMLNSFVLYPSTICAYNEDKVVNWVTSKSEYYMITNKLDVK